MTIAARKATVFKPSKELAERVNRAAVAGVRIAEPPAPEAISLAEPSQRPAKVHGDKIT